MIHRDSHIHTSHWAKRGRQLATTRTHNEVGVGVCFGEEGVVGWGHTVRIYCPRMSMAPQPTNAVYECGFHIWRPNMGIDGSHLCEILSYYSFTVAYDDHIGGLLADCNTYKHIQAKVETVCASAVLAFRTRSIVFVGWLKAWRMPNAKTNDTTDISVQEQNP